MQTGFTIILGIALIGAIMAIIAFVSEQFAKRTSKHSPNGPYERFFKYPMDTFFATEAFIFLLPMMIVIAILVRMKLGTPVIFVQKRPGKDEKIFNLYKFRSMTNAKDENGNLLPDRDRLTTFGRLLRSTSLDELPELFNIIKGDMSIIGPRPLLVKYLPYYNVHDRRRHEVRPGLTGLAQSNGRNELTWKEKFQKDVEYVDNLTFRTDIHVFFQTIKKVIIREGIEFKKDHQSVMDYFEGQYRGDGL